MSQSKNRAGEDKTDFVRAGARQSMMMTRGRSLSGHERHCCFLNTGRCRNPSATDSDTVPRDHRFANISAVSGLDLDDDGRALGLVDWDHDGDIDLWISNRNAPRLRFMRNDTPSRNHWVAFRLQGNGESTNRDAIGARVELILNSPKSIKTLRAGEGFLAQSSKWIHFGLGKSDKIHDVIVHWPGGKRERFGAPDVDARYALIQGSGTASRWRHDRPPVRFEPTTLHLPAETRRARILLVNLFPMPSLAYKTFDNVEGTIIFNDGRPALINLWASWCAPCIKELKEFTHRARDIHHAGLDIVALSVDGVGDDRTEPGQAMALIDKLKFPFTAGRASVGTLKLLKTLHRAHIALQRDLPIPTSFLVDGEGRLVAIYIGPVSVDAVLEDLSLSVDDRAERIARSTGLAGRSIDHPRFTSIADEAEARLLYTYGIYMRKAGRLEEARHIYDAALTIMPDFLDAHRDLSTDFIRSGQWDLAKKHTAEALRLDPGSFKALNQLGTICMHEGRQDEAVALFQRALKARPKYEYAADNLAKVLILQGKAEEAVNHFSLDRKFKPKHTEPLYDLAQLLARQGKLQQAAAYYKRALEIQPNFVQGLSELATLLLAQGDLDGAIHHLKHVVRLESNSAMAHIQLAGALAQAGQMEGAQKHLKQTIRIRPDFAAAHHNLGLLAHTQGNQREAVGHYRQALRFEATLTESANNLARILATSRDASLRDGAEAVRRAERAARATRFQAPGILDTLAAAYAEAGDFDQAVKWQTKVIETADAEKFRDSARERLRLYKAGKPYRLPASL